MENEGKVIDMAEKKRKRAEKSDAKISKEELYREIIDIINHNIFVNNNPKFPHKFHLIKENHEVISICIEKENDVIELISYKAALKKLGEYIEENMPPGNPIRNLPAHHVIKAFDTWHSRKECIPMPPPFRWKSEPGLCFQRLDWDLTENPSMELPEAYDQFFDRMTPENREAALEFIGSLFIPEADRSQILWLYGQGEDGKSSIINAIGKVLGYSYTPLTVPSQSSERFFTANLVGKRWGVFSECNTPKFITGATIKSITGPEPVCIERKNQDMVQARLNAKLTVVSNYLPVLSTLKADTRRIILCEVRPLPQGFILDPNYEARLNEQVGNFINICIKKYKTNNPDHRKIKTDETRLMEIASENESDFESLIGEYIQFGNWNCPGILFTEFKNDLFKNDKRRGDHFTSFMRRKYPEIRYGRFRSCKKIIAGYIGFKLCDEYLKQLERHRRLCPTSYAQDRHDDF